MIQLEDWGYHPTFADAYASTPVADSVPARVIEEQRDGYRVMTAAGERRAMASGRLRHQAAEREALPAVGDWVVLGLPPAADQGVIHAVLPRRTALLRKEAGATTTAQVIAANVDHVLLLTSLNSDLEPRRIERYLAAIWESGAAPALVLTKADVCEDPAAPLRALGDVTLGVDVHVVSALSGAGLEALERYTQPGRTIALVGSSGVGKSTLLNALAGEVLQHVNEIRLRDERGQHTTTARRLLRMPSGALWVDTPGMREFGLWSAGDGLAEVFDDVAQLALACRFTDCSHAGEPGCAIAAAIDEGRLEAERLASWLKLQREQAFLERKLDRRARLEHKRKNRRFSKSIRAKTQARKRERGPGG